MLVTHNQESCTRNAQVSVQEAYKW